ncbi:MAG TPA: hypothetical protein VGI63_01270 [Verrucomicrobiae bacterium]
MFARLGKVLVVAALVVMTGAHWAALQTVAWTTMFAANMSCDSFTQAVSKTFDGEHPCCLCKAIAAAKKSGKKSEAVSSALKMEFPLLKENWVLIAPRLFEEFSTVNTFAELRPQKPLLPPPRNCFA